LDLIKALLEMKNEEQGRFEIIMVGRIKDKAYARQILNIAERNQIKLDLLGEVDDNRLRTILSQTDLLVFPSQADDYRVEGLGLAILEAAIERIPTLGSLHGGIPEAIQDQVTGWICDTSDAKVFANCLLEIAQNRGECIKRGKQARNWVLSQFSYEKNVQKLFAQWFPEQTS